jgi:hypothetical protein
MKRAILIAGAGLLLLAANAVNTSRDAQAWRDHWSCRVTNTDTPPPIECPMCGGNAELHRKRMRALIGLQAMLMMDTLATQ